MIIKITVCPGQFIEGLRNKKKDQKQSACKIQLCLKCLPRNQQTNAPTMALFHTFPPIPHRVPTQATSHSKIHPGDLSCPALMLRHLVAPTPLPSRGWLQLWQSRKCICFRFPTLQQPSPPKCSCLAQKKKTSWCANFLLSALASCWCCPPLHTQRCLTSLSQYTVWAYWWRSQVKCLHPFMLDTEKKSKLK